MISITQFKVQPIFNKETSNLQLPTLDFIKEICVIFKDLSTMQKAVAEHLYSILSQSKTEQKSSFGHYMCLNVS